MTPRGRESVRQLCFVHNFNNHDLDYYFVNDRGPMQHYSFAKNAYYVHISFIICDDKLSPLLFACLQAGNNVTTNSTFIDIRMQMTHKRTALIVHVINLCLTSPQSVHLMRLKPLVACFITRWQHRPCSTLPSKCWPLETTS